MEEKDFLEGNFQKNSFHTSNSRCSETRHSRSNETRNSTKCSDSKYSWISVCLSDQDQEFQRMIPYAPKQSLRYRVPQFTRVWVFLLNIVSFWIGPSRIQGIQGEWKLVQLLVSFEFCFGKCVRNLVNFIFNSIWSLYGNVAADISTLFGWRQIDW